ncbi:O-antigen ligase family protein [Halomonas organivorans]|uniref:O-antigen ligase n=1 Tax=Halomonas organivorans TaxID=257772 RepID=A0A7W5C264_9GAMM|nr:O-antigen ligase family protein [Halomonas organivorans]MBB3143487.1 O-antigen ligase [Halomonas organivorans]
MNPASSMSMPVTHRYTSIAVFLLGALSLIVSSGYSIGAALLLGGGLLLLVRRQCPRLGGRDWALVAVMAAFSLFWMLHAWFDGQGTSGLDKPSRFLLAVPALLWVMARPPRLAYLWAGLSCGAIGAGSWAAWQKLVQGAGRADGFTFVIQFGNISMLLGVLCLAGLGWATRQPRRRGWAGFLLLGALMGILGSLFSGSRGGWVGFPFILLVLYRGYGEFLSVRLKIAVLAVVLTGAGLVYALPQTGVQSRVHQAVEDVQGYVAEGNSHSSVGARFEMWRGASLLILDRPLLGWGENGYVRGMKALADAGTIDAFVTRYGHAHNEFIDAFAKRGIIGFGLLLALYLLPLRWFARRLSEPNLDVRSIAVAGVLLPVAYMDFGLSQTFLAHNSGVMVFAFWLAVFYGSLRAYERPEWQERA